ncbi:AurF N-oxygenase family protein [Hoyosella subflava]|uniref:Uncharacterized protein n=1 Tax=Hoyosella subflava (strain DSM 45089 / JCM 17490 / NBRC 109087 / DQS3-9A1) TaxID=443218 RepID=F6EJL7_HOYSD|nr:diiron oxygenase [Hoyosella subflava]AEF39066.1 hypothetical protein AS9A_0612 [Hoyosella subflava DQS3-9A1]
MSIVHDMRRTAPAEGARTEGSTRIRNAADVESVAFLQVQTTESSAEETGRRLLDSAARKSLDPATEIDWEAPLDPSLYGMTPEWSSLYGTELWERMTPEQRITLTNHEAASISGTGIWFEMILMQMLLRDIYWRDAATSHVQFGLTEIADECRHSTMFARAATKMGVPSYKPGKAVMHLANAFKSVATGALAYGGTLFAEEILDMMQRDFMRDERVQPVTRAVSQIHVLEEARHIRFAREETIRRMREVNWVQREGARLILGITAYFIVTELINPGAYKAAGLNPKEAKKAARENPHYQRKVREGSRKSIEFLDSVGLIGGPSKFLLRRANII